MRIAGTEITQEQVEAMERAMWYELADPRGFTWYNHIAARAIVYEGFPDNLAVNGGDLAAHAASRLLKRERKAGRIRHVGGGKWERVTA